MRDQDLGGDDRVLRRLRAFQLLVRGERLRERSRRRRSGLREWLVELEGWHRTGRTELASWILPRLTQPPGLVCGSVPDGFGAYARICHPVPVAAGPSLSWRQVAGVTGAVVHPLMQWQGLIGAGGPYARRSARWKGGSPAWGHLESDAFQRLAAVLRTHTGTVDDSLCGYWVGWTRATRVTITAV